MTRPNDEPLITKTKARNMIAQLNRQATRYSELISAENARRRERAKADGTAEKNLHVARFSDEQRGSYERAIRELEHIKEGRPQADHQRASEEFETAMKEIAAGIAELSAESASV